MTGRPGRRNSGKCRTGQSFHAKLNNQRKHEDKKTTLSGRTKLYGLRVMILMLLVV